MYGDERPHDKALKVNAFLLFLSPVHAAISLTLSVFAVNPARARACVCRCVRARVGVCPRVRAPACGFTQQAR